MVRYKDKEKAITLRKKGMSYSQIKEKLNVSKSTLSVWLRDMPLSEKRMRELRDNSQQRIEKTRETKRKKKSFRFQKVYDRAVDDIGSISKRELFIAGLFLYWGEGLKADPYTVMFTNTDPAMVKCFIKWIHILGVEKDELKVYLHVYKDMSIPETITYWSNELGIKKQKFRKPYVKKTLRNKHSNYKGRFNRGTCNVYIGSRDLRERIGMSIERLREMYGNVAFDPEKAL